MASFPLLSSIIIVPLIGAFIAFLIKGEEKNISKNLRELAIWTSLVELILSIILVFQFDFSNNNFQFIEEKNILTKLSGKDILSIPALNSTMYSFKPHLCKINIAVSIPPIGSIYLDDK